MVDDRIQVEVTPYDFAKGRIIVRERAPHSGRPLQRGQRRRSIIQQAHNRPYIRNIMNFRTYFLFKPFLPGFLKPGQPVRGVVHQPAATGATLSRHDLRRMVAEMVD